MSAINEVDVVIVGAGLSGIGAAYHLQTKCPEKSFVILEGRDALGGTWDLFRYPGIRSDSDMYTLGFSFRPWKGEKSIADGASILAYLRETAEESGIDRKIRFRHKVERARWSSVDARWTVEARGPGGELVTLRCKFIFGCAGYYDYESGYTPEFEGVSEFGGRIVHPQRWSDDVDYAGKRVVVIGSGATAMTLVPAMAKDAAHVTMVQRSPTYVVSMPAKDPIAAFLRRLLPEGVAYAATRWKNVLFASAFYKGSRRFPDAARRMILGKLTKALGKERVDAHFSPRYRPWDQRVCLVPDGDLFSAIAEGRASVATGEIATCTKKGLRLRSGEEIEADVIVTATGLRLKLLGGIALEVDGRAIDPSRCFLYKGVMLSGVPNLALSIGYTNASWTLKCDLTCEFVCRLLAHMDAHGIGSACPRRPANADDEEPLINFSSGYVARAGHLLPKQGRDVPWRLHQDYVRDLRLLRAGAIADPALELTPRARGVDLARRRHRSRLPTMPEVQP